MLLLLLALLCLQYVVLVESCGHPAIPIKQTRIVGGYEATQGSLPWMVLLLELDDPTCGGSIINERVILTAAHCFEDPISKDVKRWKVRVGEHHLNKIDQTETTHTVEKIITHENYNQDTVANDIAIVVLRERIMYNRYVSPICLPRGDQSARVGMHCIAAGWGATKGIPEFPDFEWTPDNDKIIFIGTADPNVLNQVFVSILNDYFCSKQDWYGDAFISATTFCAGYAHGGRDSCTGDSGGPLICNYLNVWYQIGITSWGYDCARPKWPGIYTDVKLYMNWIEGKLALLGYSL